MITETRKAIIELINPYMDENNGLHALYNEINKSEFEYNSETYYIDDFDICYDITAVLKYINAIVWQSNLKIKAINGREIIMQDTREVLYQNIILPNKPLHLYTEEEDKELLYLLTNLK